MYGLTRALATLIGAAVAGFLVWLASQTLPAESLGDYWLFVGLLAAAGFALPLSQIVGGWTKWGWPRVSPTVFLLAFVPALVVGGWIILAGQPETGWLSEETREDWADDLGVRGLVNDLGRLLPVIAFGLGALLGFTLDTSGPPREVVHVDDRRDEDEHERDRAEEGEAEREAAEAEAEYERAEAEREREAEERAAEDDVAAAREERDRDEDERRS